MLCHCVLYVSQMKSSRINALKSGEISVYPINRFGRGGTRAQNGFLVSAGQKGKFSVGISMGELYTNPGHKRVSNPGSLDYQTSPVLRRTPLCSDNRTWRSGECDAICRFDSTLFYSPSIFILFLHKNRNIFHFQ